MELIEISDLCKVYGQGANSVTALDHVSLTIEQGEFIAIIGTDTPLYTQLTIHDSGPGFAPQDIPRLFDRFYQGQKTSTGYGIGLSLSKMIITRQNGTITAANHPQGGALFTIRFPK